MRGLIRRILKENLFLIENRSKISNDEFILRLKNIFGDEYGLEKIDYKGQKEPVTLTCPIHGEFEKVPEHLYRGQGCPKCYALKRGEKKSQNFGKKILDKFKEIHGNKYDYSKFEYFKSNVPSVIICPKHGEFQQTPSKHLDGQGCKQCAQEQPKYNSLSTNEFIKKAREIHGDKYDYNQLVYKNAKTPVSITCPVHGEFQQIPFVHLRSDCPKCGKTLGGKHRLEKSKNSLIDVFREVHGDKFSYDKVNYQGNNVKIIITCPQHGDFEQTPGAHKGGQGCPVCGNQKSPYNDSIFIDKATQVHGGKYDYSLVKNVVNSRSLVDIICPVHGTFTQQVMNHVIGKGCEKCYREFRAGQATKKDNEDFIDSAIETHGDRYDYSKVNYLNAKTPVEIICKVHGPFSQIPRAHIRGNNCPKCVGGVQLTSDEFIKNATQIHGNIYDYSLVDYENSSTPVSIICQKHGEFTQKPSNHLGGSGCPFCSESRGEKAIRNALETLRISYEKQKKFDECINVSMGKNNKEYCIKLPFDFFLPEYNLLIEYDGLQHFQPVDKFGGEKSFRKTQILDKIKNDFASNNNIELLRIPYTVKPKNILSYLKKYFKTE
jgi:hypothetical protein